MGDVANALTKNHSNSPINGIPPHLVGDCIHIILPFPTSIEILLLKSPGHLSVIILISIFIQKQLINQHFD